MFEAAYPGERFEQMTFAHAANAIAAFEVAGFEAIDSPLQRFLRGDAFALSGLELEGAQAFFRSDCDQCHEGPQLSDFDHHNTALAQLGPGKGHGPDGNDNFGREGVTGDPDDRYRFRTTPLHNVELTGPYGHAGQLQDLEDVVDHYDDAEDELADWQIRDHIDDPSLWDTVVNNRAAIARRIAPELRRNRNVRDEEAIVAFLLAMTDPGSLDQSHLIPDSVPSGLPVAD